MECSRHRYTNLGITFGLILTMLLCCCFCLFGCTVTIGTQQETGNDSAVELPSINPDDYLSLRAGEVIVMMKNGETEEWKDSAYDNRVSYGVFKLIDAVGKDEVLYEDKYKDAVYLLKAYVKEVNSKSDDIAVLRLENSRNGNDLLVSAEVNKDTVVEQNITSESIVLIECVNWDLGSTDDIGLPNNVYKSDVQYSSQ